MSKQASTVEWYIAQNDAEWESLCSVLTTDGTPETAPAGQIRLFSRPVLSSVVVILLLATASGWWWRTAQAGLQQRAAEVRAPAELALAAMPDTGPFAARPSAGEWLQHTREVRDVHTAIQTISSDANFDIAVQSIDV